ncbi:hypothetical protein QJS83_05880 [Bdellovibrio sp. 22V]|uniref:hypothetical protein n=1 Tax=Bdellovibrio sp. 22V TaxID=3044166 RepID=UPI0025431F66|nr:hypothetical protein [Bdellovibrio sp. 22V]WII73397.1 hypothetical protein QJS83_05880 [Bdellovibrio sp. 22V]
MLSLRSTIPVALMSLSLGAYSSANARTMQCGVQMVTASHIGLVPMDDEFVLAAAPVTDTSKCATTTVKNMTLSLCAAEETEALGIYKVQVSMSDSEGRIATAREILATSKNDAEDLISIYSECDFTPQFVRKMHAAGLQYPGYRGGDSLMIDRAVAAAFQKGVLDKHDIVLFNIGNCELK